MIKSFRWFSFNLFIFISFACLSSPSKTDSLNYRLAHPKNDTDKVNTYVCLCQLWYQSQPDTALFIAGKAYELAKQCNYMKGKAATQNAMGSAELVKGNFVSALKHFEQSLRLRVKLGNKLDIADSYHNIAIAWSSLGDSQKCLFYNFKALTLREQTGNKAKTAMSYNNIGIIYKDMGYYDKALSYYNKALAIYIQLKDVDQQASCYGNISMAYLQMHQAEKAIEYALKSKAISEKTNNKSNLSINYANLGMIYTDLHRYDEALSNYNASLCLLKKMGAESKQANVMQLIARLWLDRHYPAKAIEYALPTYTITKRWHIPIGMSESAEILSTAYEQLNKPALALFYYKITDHINDSLFSIEKEKAIANLDARHELNEKQKELNLLTIKMRVQRNTTYALFAGLLIIIAISIVFFSLYYKLQNAHRKLVMQQLDILKAEAYSDVLINGINSSDALEKTTESPSIATKKPVNNIAENHKVANITNDTEPPLELMARIIHLMENEKLYLDPNLTLEQLAERMNTNKTYLSQLINTYFHKNFNKLINEYRINTVLNWMTNHENANLSFEGMALKAGFNNRTTFYEAFKHFTGVTPSFFKSSLPKH